MRIGFACQRHPNCDEQKVKTTTLTHARSLDNPQAKLKDLVNHNARSVYNLVSSVAKEPKHFRLLRISSGLWPLCDHPEFQHHYERGLARSSEKTLIKAGELAQSKGITLSFHPDQFNALASTDRNIVENTIRTLNIAGRQAALLGITNIVIHCWGRGGIAAFKANMGYLNNEVLERLVIENDEFGVGMEALLDADIGLPLVLDPHHYWVNTGKWPAHDVFYAAKRTWNRRAKIHYSYPRYCELTSGWPEPSGNRNHDRAHSDNFYNRTVSEYILEEAHLLDLDILVEAKHKDVARDRLAKLAKLIGYI